MHSFGRVCDLDGLTLAEVEGLGPAKSVALLMHAEQVGTDINCELDYLALMSRLAFLELFSIPASCYGIR